MRLGAADEGPRRVQLAALLDVPAAGGRVEEHGDQAEAKNRHQRRVQLGGHRVKHQHGVPRAQAVPPQQTGGAGGQSV